MREMPGFIVYLYSLICFSLSLFPSGLLAGGSDGLVVPRHFIPNTGQWHSSVRYGAIGTNAKVAFTDRGVHLFVPSTRNQDMKREIANQAGAPEGQVLEHIYIEFENPSPACVVAGGKSNCSNVNIYHGSNEDTWRTGMRGVESVRYSGLWEGIDLTFSFENGRLVERVSCMRAADTRRIRYTVHGRSAAREVLSSIRVDAPSMDTLDWHQLPVDTTRFTPGKDLSSWRYLTRTEFCTFFGGSEYDTPLAIAVDDSSRLSFVMETSSIDLPVLHPVQSTLCDSSDMYIGTMSPDGRRLLFGTYLGGTRSDGLELTAVYGSSALCKDTVRDYLSPVKLRCMNDGRLVLLAATSSYDFPVTDGALQRKSIGYRGMYRFMSDPILVSLSNDGRLLGSSYFSGPTMTLPIDMTIDRNGDIYVLGTAHGEQWCVTPQGYQPTLHNPNLTHTPPLTRISTAFITKLSSTLDHVHWGSYFLSEKGDNTAWLDSILCQNCQYGDPDLGDHCSVWTNYYNFQLLVDGRGQAIIVGALPTDTRLPKAKRTYGTSSSETLDLFIVVFSADGRSVVQSSRIRSQSHDTFHHAAVDSDDNLFVLADCYADTFPELTAPLLTPPVLPPGTVSSILFKFAPDGALLNSAWLPRPATDAMEIVEYSWLKPGRCGDLLLLGYATILDTSGAWDSAPRLGTQLDPAKISCIATIDAGLRQGSYKAFTFLYDGLPEGLAPQYSFPGDFHSTHIRHWKNWAQYFHYNSFIRLGKINPDLVAADKAGYIYNASTKSTGRDAFRPLEIFNAFSAQDRPQDAVLMRHFYPSCDMLACDLAMRDQILIDTVLDLIVDEVFPLTVTLSHVRRDVPALELWGDVFLPAGLVFENGGRTAHVHFSPSQLRPGERVQHTWQVRVMPEEFVSDTIEALFIGYYREDGMDGNIPPMLIPCSRRLAIVRQGDAKVSCDITAPISPFSSWKAPPFHPIRVPIMMSVVTASAIPLQIGGVILHIPKDAGIRLVPEDDSLRPGFLLARRPGVALTWNIECSPRSYVRVICIEGVVLDNNGQPFSRCVTCITIPAVQGSGCRTILPRSLWYDIPADQFEFERVTFTLFVTNHLDTSLGDIACRVDLSHARHLDLAAHEPINRIIPSIAAYQEGSASWKLATKGTVKTVETDTVVVYYNVLGNPTEQACTAVISYEPRDAVPACQVDGPTLLVVDDDRYASNPAQFSVSIENKGLTVIHPRQLVLSCEPNHRLRLTGASIYTLQDIAPGASFTVTFEVLASTSLYADSARILAAILDKDGRIISTCEHAIFLPAVQSPRCEIELPDSIQFHEGSMECIPDSLAIELMIYNPLDTALVNLTVLLDASGAPCLTNRPGFPLAVHIPLIDPRDSMQIHWVLQADTACDPGDVMNIAVRINGNAPWIISECVGQIDVKRISANPGLHCDIDGHDSLYIDPAYEMLVPRPIQAALTLRNSGNTPLHNVHATILLPQGFALHEGQARRSFGNMLPSASKMEVWTIMPDDTMVLPGSYTFDWQLESEPLPRDAVACTHTVSVKMGAASQLVFSPKYLFFKANQGAALPTEQQVQIWTPDAMPSAWDVTLTMPWCDASPVTGFGPSKIGVQPNTTLLDKQTHAAVLHLNEAGNTAGSVHIFYTIDGVSAVVQGSVPSEFELTGVYPNPVSVQERQNPTFLVSARRSSHLTVTVHDILGRSVLSPMDLSVEAGRQEIRMDYSMIRYLAPGLYTIVLRSPESISSGIFVVIP